MTTIIFLFGVFIIVMTAWGIVMPTALMKYVLRIWNQPWGIYLAIAVRIGLGVVFILAASETRYPDLFHFLGYLMIFAAVLIAVIGRERLDRFIQWWVKASPMLARALLALGFLFGIFVLHAINWRI